MTISIDDLGAKPGLDTTPFFEEALDLIALDDATRIITFGPREYEFHTAPKTMTQGITLMGEGGDSQLVRRYSGGTFLAWYGGGGGLRDLVVEAGPGTTGGVGVYVRVDEHQAGGNQAFENITVSGVGVWYWAMYLDGYYRALQPPIGVRTVFLSNVKLFCATIAAAQWWNSVSCEWYGGGAWQGGGTTQQVRVEGPIAQKNRIDADITTSMYQWGAMR